MIAAAVTGALVLTHVRIMRRLQQGATLRRRRDDSGGAALRSATELQRGPAVQTAL